MFSSVFFRFALLQISCVNDNAHFAVGRQVNFLLMFFLHKDVS